MSIMPAMSALVIESLEYLIRYIRLIRQATGPGSTRNHGKIWYGELVKRKKVSKRCPNLNFEATYKHRRLEAIMNFDQTLTNCKEGKQWLC